MSKYEIEDVFIVCYADETPPETPPVAPPVAPEGITPEMQVIIDKQVANAVKDRDAKAQRAMAELEALKKRDDLTKSQREELEKRFETIQKDLLTKEQLFEQDKKKKEKEFTKQVETLSSELDTWKNRYTESTIIRAISDASVKNEAFDSDTIVAILRPNTKLMDTLDSEGQPTGAFDVKVNFLDPEGKDGKPTEMLLAVPDAVKRMAELEKYQYLFKGKGTGGAGRNNSGKGKPMDLASLAKDPKAYREARKAGQL